MIIHVYSLLGAAAEVSAHGVLPNDAASDPLAQKGNDQFCLGGQYCKKHMSVQEICLNITKV
jgi:hypothetical protein